jgi:hypothetical protein
MFELPERKVPDGSGEALIDALNAYASQFGGQQVPQS